MMKVDMGGPLNFDAHFDWSFDNRESFGSGSSDPIPVSPSGSFSSASVDLERGKETLRRTIYQDLKEFLGPTLKYSQGVGVEDLIVPQGYIDETNFLRTVNGKKKSIQSIADSLTTEGREEGYIVEVQLRYTFRYCQITAPKLREMNICVGSMLIMHCSEKQFDIGVVTRLYTVSKFQRFIHARGKSEDHDENTIGKIIRHASVKERQYMPIKYKRENELFEVCKQLAETMNVPMTVYGVELLLDGSKLTVYYTAKIHVDYREYVAELFTIFKIRIWMKKTNRCFAFKPKEFASNSLTTGVLCPADQCVV